MKQGLKILVVDDEENVLKSIKKVISSRHPDIKIDITSSPDYCLELVKSEKYDLIISDLLMPGMNGAELMDKIKEIVPDQKIIIITGYANLKNYTEVTEKGASNFIPKPYTREELLTAIYLLF